MVPKKEETTLLVILITKSFLPFWAPLYVPTIFARRSKSSFFWSNIRFPRTSRASLNQEYSLIRISLEMIVYVKIFLMLRILYVFNVFGNVYSLNCRYFLDIFSNKLHYLFMLQEAVSFEGEEETKRYRLAFVAPRFKLQNWSEKSLCSKKENWDLDLDYICI